MMKYFHKLFNYYHFSMRVPYVLKHNLPGQCPNGYPSQTRQLYNVIEILVNSTHCLETRLWEATIGKPKTPSGTCLSGDSKMEILKKKTPPDYLLIWMSTGWKQFLIMDTEDCWLKNEWSDDGKLSGFFFQQIEHSTLFRFNDFNRSIFFFLSFYFRERNPCVLMNPLSSAPTHWLKSTLLT